MKTRIKYFTMIFSILFFSLSFTQADVSALAGSLDVTLNIKECAGVGADGYPITVVVPLPYGEYQDVDRFRVVDAVGETVPAQFNVLNRWWVKDKSIRHVKIEFQPTVGKFTTAGTGITTYHLKDDGSGNIAETDLKVTETTDLITVITGPLKFTVKKTGGFNIINEAWLDTNYNGTFESDELIIKPTSESGGVFNFAPRDSDNNLMPQRVIQRDSERSDLLIEIEEEGPMRAVIRVEAVTKNYSAENHIHGWAVRLYAYAGKPYIKVDYQLQNSAKNVIYSSPIYFESLNLNFSLNMQGEPTVKFGMGDDSIETFARGKGHYLAQKYLQGDVSPHVTRVYNQSGNIQAELHPENIEYADRGASNYFIDISDGQKGITATTRYFWQTWPNGLAIDDTNKLSIELFPEWSKQFNPLTFEEGDYAYKMPHGFTSTGLYWLEDMQHTYKEVLLYFHGPNTEDTETELTNLTKTFEFYPVATLPVSQYTETQATLDLDGLIPIEASIATGDLRTPNYSDRAFQIKNNGESYHFGWDNFWVASTHRKRVADEHGGWPWSVSAFIATENPQDYYHAERMAFGELNIHPQWMAQYQYDTDWDFLQLTNRPYAGGSWRKFEGNPYDYYVNPAYLEGTGNDVKARDNQHGWFYHVEEAYYFTANLWIKDWYEFIAEFRKETLRGLDPTPYGRGGGHALNHALQAYRVTGDTGIIDDSHQHIVQDHLPKQNPYYGCIDALARAPAGQVAYLARSIEDFMAEIEGYYPQAYADAFNYLSGQMEWNLNYMNFSYWLDVRDGTIGVSAGTGNKFVDVQAWYYWHTGKKEFLDHFNEYIDVGINGGTRPYSPNQFDNWTGDFTGRYGMFVRNATRVDSIPPSAISDLKLETANESEVILSWTAPADAIRYHIVWSDKPISADTCTDTNFTNWWAATAVGPINPDGTELLPISGNQQSIIIDTGTTPDPIYAAVYTFDDTGNMSAMSNSPFPNAFQEDVETHQDVPLVIAVLANDIRSKDFPIDPSSIIIVQDPAHGSIDVNNAGIITYTPDSGFGGSDEFYYTVEDSNGVTSNKARVLADVWHTDELVDFDNYTLVEGANNCDVTGNADIEDEGATLHYSNANRWKAIRLMYEITSDTVLEFDFKSSNQGNYHAIGLYRYIPSISGYRGRGFKLFGTSNWGIRDFDDYVNETPGEYKHYKIPIGQYYTGKAYWLSIANRHSVTAPATPTADGYFSNVRIYEGSTDLRILTASLPDGEVGSSYSQTLRGLRGTLPYTWTVTNGTLPDGLSIASGTGVISGTPTQEGTYTFTAEVTDSASPEGSAIKQFTLTIAPVAIPTYHLTVTSGSGDGDYPENEVVNIEADAPQAGQVFKEWAGDITFVTNINNALTTVTMPPHSVTVEATYKNIPAYVITTSASSNGSINPSGSITVFEGDNLTFAITANRGYGIEEVFIDDISHDVISSYTFTDIRNDHSITASFVETVIPPGSLNVPLTVKECAGVNLRGENKYPITVVVPLKYGDYQTVDTFRVVDISGNTVPAQFDVLNRWWAKDNSIRHVKIEFQPEVGAFTTPETGISTYYLKNDGNGNILPDGSDEVTVVESPDTFVVNTGPLQFTVNKNNFNILDTVILNGETIISPDSNNGGIFKGRLEGDIQLDSSRLDVTVEVEEAGPMRAVIKAEAVTLYDNTEKHEHGFAVRIYAYAGKPFVKIDYQLQNSAMRDSEGNYKMYSWPLYFESMNLDFKLDLEGDTIVRFGMGNGTVDKRDRGEGLMLIQEYLEDDPLPHATSIYNQAGDLKTRLQPENIDYADRGTSNYFIDVSNDNHGVYATTRYFWQMWPNGLAVDSDNKLSIQLFPEKSCQFYPINQQPGDYSYRMPCGLNKTGLYWLEDMQHVYKEILLHFREVNPDESELDNKLSNISRTFELHPVAVVPVNQYKETESTLDFDGVIPISGPTATSDLRTPNYYYSSSSDRYFTITGNGESYHFNWDNFWADTHRKRTADDCGGWPYSVSAFVATENPRDYYHAERFVMAELNIHPQWMTGFNYETDNSYLKLTENPYGGPSWRNFEGHGRPYLDADYLDDTANDVEARDDEHGWFYHVEEAYYWTGNPWIKDWYKFIGEFRKIRLNARRIDEPRSEVTPGRSDPYPDRSSRARAHSVGNALQAYRVTGDPSLIDGLKNYVRSYLRREQSPYYGRKDYRILGSGSAGKESAYQMGYLTRVVIGIMKEIQDVQDENSLRAYAEGFQYLIGSIEWNYNFSNFSYHMETIDQVGISNSTGFSLVDAQYWCYWQTGKDKYKDHIEDYRDDGINGGTRPYGERSDGTNSYYDDWKGDYLGRYAMYARHTNRDDTEAPAAITGLSAQMPDAGTLRLTWNAPADAVRYHVVWAGKPIFQEVVDNHDGTFTAIDTTTDTNVTNWWAANAIQTTDTAVNITLESADPVYAAVFSFDETGNMSFISNVVSIVPSGELIIVTLQLADGISDVDYEMTLLALGGTTPYAWLITNGALPQGLSLASGTGIISGTPITNGTYSFTVELRDSSSPVETATTDLTITIDLPPAPTYRLSIQLGTGSGYYEEGIQVAIQANSPALGSVFREWIGDTDHVTRVTDPSTTVTMPNHTVTITADYGTVPVYTISASALEGGSIDPSGDQRVNGGENLTFTLTPNIDYSIRDVLVDNVSQSLDANNSYTFTNITSDHDIVARFNSALELTADITRGTTPLDVIFTCAYSGSGNVILYEWDFDGKGAFDESSNDDNLQEYSFTGAGNYPVTVRVTTDSGVSYTSTTSIDVSADPAKSPVITSLDVDKTSGSVPLRVRFSVAANDPDGEIQNYAWDFNGDGLYEFASDSSNRVVKNYSLPGAYPASVKVTDDEGLTATRDILIDVSSHASSPTVTLEAVPLSGTVPLTVNFFADASGGEIIRYQWDFDSDGRLDMVTVNPRVTYIYTNVGTYRARVRVINNNHLHAQASQTITVISDPPDDMKPPQRIQPIQGDSPLTVDFGNLVNGITGVSAFMFDFDGDKRFDQRCGTDATGVSYTYTKVGMYRAYIRLIGDQGWEKTLTVRIHVRKPGIGNVYIKVPKDNWTISGSHVTLLAKVDPDLRSHMQSAQFQYRAQGASQWIPLGNPFFRLPLVITHLDTTFLTNGIYEIQCVVTPDGRGQYDNPVSSQPVLVTIDNSPDADPEVRESIDENGNYTKEQAVVKDEVNEVELDDGTNITLPYPDMLANDDTLTVQTVKETEVTLPTLDSTVKLTGTYRRISLSAGHATFTRDVEISIPYGIEDLGDISEEDLKIFYFNIQTKEWEETFDSMVLISEKVVTAKTHHFSLFGLGSGGDSFDTGGGIATEGCFIATAAYGTPMADEVKALSEFRDKYLLKNRIGEQIVKFYYHRSPKIATRIRENSMQKKAIRGILKPVVWMVKRFCD